MFGQSYRATLSNVHQFDAHDIFIGSSRSSVADSIDQITTNIADIMELHTSLALKADVDNPTFTDKITITSSGETITFDPNNVSDHSAITISRSYLYFGINGGYDLYMQDGGVLGLRTLKYYGTGDIAITDNVDLTAGKTYKIGGVSQYTNSEIDVKFANYYTSAQLDAGQLDTRYYTETEADSLFAPVSHTHDDRYYTETEADSLFASASHTHDDRYYTETEADSLFALASHTHDDRYYTETEADSLFALASHTHSTSEITDLSTYNNFASYYPITTVDNLIGWDGHKHATPQYEWTSEDPSDYPIGVQCGFVRQADQVNYPTTFGTILNIRSLQDSGNDGSCMQLGFSYGDLYTQAVWFRGGKYDESGAFTTWKRFANYEDHYLKTDVDTLLGGKSDTSHTHTTFADLTVELLTVDGATNGNLYLDRGVSTGEASIRLQNNGSSVWLFGLDNSSDLFSFYSYSMADNVVYIDNTTGKFTVVNETALDGNVTVQGYLDIDSTSNAFLYLDRGASSDVSQLRFRTAGSSSWWLGTQASTSDFSIYNTGAVETSLTIDATTSDVSIKEKLDVVNDFSVNTNKFNVTASSGDVDIAGDLDVAGSITNYFKLGSTTFYLQDSVMIAGTIEFKDADNTASESYWLQRSSDNFVIHNNMTPLMTFDHTTDVTVHKPALFEGDLTVTDADIIIRTTDTTPAVLTLHGNYNEASQGDCYIRMRETNADFGFNIVYNGNTANEFRLESVNLGTVATRLKINRAGGEVYLPEVYSDSVTGRDLYISSSGQLGYVSSTLKSKTNIRDAPSLSWVYNVELKQFNYRKKLEVEQEDGSMVEEYTDEADATERLGFVAEQVAEVIPEEFDESFLYRNPETRELDGIGYTSFIPVLVKLIQELKKEVDELKSRLPTDSE